MKKLIIISQFIFAVIALGYSQILRIDDQFSERNAASNGLPIGMEIYKNIPFLFSSYTLDTSLSPRPFYTSVLKVDTSYTSDTFSLVRTFPDHYSSMALDNDHIVLDYSTGQGNNYTYSLNTNGIYEWQRDTIMADGPSSQFSSIYYSDITIFNQHAYSIRSGNFISSVLRKYNLTNGELIKEWKFADSIANFHFLKDSESLFLIGSKMHLTGSLRSIDYLYVSQIDTAGNTMWSSEFQSPDTRFLIPEIVKIKGDYIYIAAKHYYFKHYVELFCYNKNNGNLEWSRVIAGNMPSHIDIHGNNLHISTNKWENNGQASGMYLYRMDTSGSVVDSFYKALPNGQVAGAATDSLNYTFVWEIENQLPYLRVYDPNLNLVTEHPFESWYLGGVEQKEESYPISKFSYSSFQMDSKGRVYIGTLHHPDTDSLSYKTMSVRKIELTDRPEVVDSAYVSIKDIEEEEGFILYPNPNSGSFTIKYSLKEENNTLLIYDLYGKVLKRLKLQVGENEKSISLKNAASGIYFYQVVSEEGILVKSGKLLLQK